MVQHMKISKLLSKCYISIFPAQPSSPFFTTSPLKVYNMNDGSDDRIGEEPEHNVIPHSTARIGHIVNDFNFQEGSSISHF